MLIWRKSYGGIIAYVFAALYISFATYQPHFRRDARLTRLASRRLVEMCKQSH